MLFCVVGPPDDLVPEQTLMFFCFAFPGKMKMDHYLDDYPFPYYIVLKDIKSLPEIVSDALRQWFELIHKTM